MCCKICTTDDRKALWELERETTVFIPYVNDGHPVVVRMTTFCSVVVEMLFLLGGLLYFFNESIDCAREIFKSSQCFEG